MSDLARRTRSARRRWARPGSGHDRVVGVSRTVLPVLIGVLFAFLVFMPLRGGGDVSFLLDRNKVQVARERLRLQTAVYRGADARGRPFMLSADQAVQKSSAEPVVQLTGLSGEIALPDGPATLAATRGRYDMRRDEVGLVGDVRLHTTNGYSVTTSDATVELKGEHLHSNAPATGTLPNGGRFSADRLRADLVNDVLVLDGNARLRIVPGRRK
ncbi:MAG: LPS export ABC transporter periplasmic protein LptC [Proteobacteria bacterium SG_bin5]|nr:LPS export ABC transporter periplasmic protein LptC [Sphingomonas sp.]OQW44947.1 MAG: LPS export ABC transporter periplasmic protein LptC [Proteobacteria bacterium SG_bin5]